MRNKISCNSLDANANVNANANAKPFGGTCVCLNVSTLALMCIEFKSSDMRDSSNDVRMP